MEKKSSKNPDLSPMREMQLLIEKFCKKESINWPREMKLIKSLLKQEPLEFWKFLVLGFNLASLAWFNSKDGKQEIAKTKKIFLQLQKPEKVEIKNDIKYVRTTEQSLSSIPLKDRLKLP
jgi:hypothetical protein